jgi:hypothetical protein
MDVPSGVLALDAADPMCMDLLVPVGRSLAT